MKKLFLLIALSSASFAFGSNPEPARPAEAPKQETGSASGQTAAKKTEAKAQVKDCCAPVEPAQKPAGK